VFAIEPGDEEVEADLPDRDGITGGDPPLKRGEVGVGMARDVDRVQAVGGVQVGMGRAQRAQVVPTGGVHRRDDEASDPSGTAARQHRIAVGGEGVDVEVAVGVDQLQRAAPVAGFRRV
jgi:hypothetical protein